MMEQLANDPWFKTIGALQLVASIAALIFVVGRRRRHSVLLPYEPRRPVPWGPAGAWLAVVFTAVSISSAFSTDNASANHAEPSPQQIMLSLAASMVMQSLGPMLLLFIAA